MNYCVKHQQVYEERCYQCDEYNEKDRPEQGEHEQKNDENDPIEEIRASDAPYGGHVPYSTGTVCAECGMHECMCHEGEPSSDSEPIELDTHANKNERRVHVTVTKEDMQVMEPVDVKVPDTRTSKKQWTPERRAKFRETFRLKREAKAKGLQDPQTGFIKKEPEEKDLDFLHDFQCWDCAYRFKNINEDASKIKCPNCGGADITKGTIAESKDN